MAQWILIYKKVFVVAGFYVCNHSLQMCTRIGVVVYGLTPLLYAPLGSLSHETFLAIDSLPYSGDQVANLEEWVEIVANQCEHHCYCFTVPFAWLLCNFKRRQIAPTLGTSLCSWPLLTSQSLIVSGSVVDSKALWMAFMHILPSQFVSLFACYTWNVWIQCWWSIRTCSSRRSVQGRQRSIGGLQYVSSVALVASDHQSNVLDYVEEHGFPEPKLKNIASPGYFLTSTEDNAGDGIRRALCDGIYFPTLRNEINQVDTLKIFFSKLLLPPRIRHLRVRSFAEHTYSR